jgi:DNA-binding IclR family transcriptional regulator
MSSKSTPTPEIQALASALRLLEIVAEFEGEGMSELGRRAFMTHNQTHRILATFERYGYVIRNDSRGYQIGPKPAMLERRTGRYRSLIEAAFEPMNQLASLSGESVLLAIRDRLERMVIDSRPSSHSLRVDWSIGSRLPLHVGGLGVALLAFAPAAIQHALLSKPQQRFTKHTLETDALKIELEHVRKTQVRISKDDYSTGEFSVAAPILNSRGESIAAINIAGFTARLTPTLERQYSKAVREAARQIARAIVE